MTHNEYLIENYTSPETVAAFQDHVPDEVSKWVSDAITEFESSVKTKETRERYIGKIALAHNFWESQQ